MSQSSLGRVVGVTLGRAKGGELSILGLRLARLKLAILTPGYLLPLLRSLVTAMLARGFLLEGCLDLPLLVGTKLLMSFI